MVAVLDAYEYNIMKCISGQDKKLCVAEIQKMLLDMGEVQTGEASVRISLDQLVKKKMLKKRYAKVSTFRWKTLYQSRYSKEYLLSHIQNLDISMEMDIKACEMKKLQKKLEYNPFVIAEFSCYSPEERLKMQKLIEQLDVYDES